MDSLRLLNSKTWVTKIKNLLSKTVNLKQFKLELFNLIPDMSELEGTGLSEVSPQICDELTSYIFFNYSQNTTKTITALQYLIGLLEYNLVDTNDLRRYYCGFLYFLKHSKLRKLNCKLLYFLIKNQDDVKREYVLEILKSEPAIPAIYALLNLMKSIRPENVPEKFKVPNISTAFSKLPEVLKNNLEISKRHYLDSIETNKRLDNFTNVMTIQDEINGICHVRKKFKSDLNQPIKYLSIGSRQYNQEFFNKKTIFEFKNLNTLILQLNELVYPCNVSSLITIETGRYFLKFSPEHIKQRFYYFLQQAFYHELFEPSNLSTELESKIFFENVLEYTKLVKQLHPSVTYHLVKFAYLYSFENLTDTQLELLEYASFDTFNEYKQNLLEPIKEHMLFSVDNQFLKLNFLLLRIIENIILYQIAPIEWQFNQEFFGYFKDSPREFLNNLTKWIENYCYSILEYQQSIQCQSIVLIIYETILKFEQLHKSFSFYCMPPENLFYGCLVSYDAFQIEHLLNVYQQAKSTNQNSVRFNKLKICISHVMVRLWYKKKSLALFKGKKFALNDEQTEFYTKQVKTQMNFLQHLAFDVYFNDKQSKTKNEICKINFPTLHKMIKNRKEFV